MDYYNKFSEYYDYIFPFQLPQYNFLKGLIKPGDKVLDLACGTGNYIIKICQELNVQGVGIDLDGAMIKKAQQKGANLKNLKLMKKNMLDISDIKERYNLIYCIGNSLPHLTKSGAIADMLKGIYNKLEDGGIVVLQTVNYDKKPSSLKTIINRERGLEFIRDYNYEGNLVGFCTVLKGDDFEVRGKVQLYPLRSEELETMLKTTGFVEIKMFGSFNKEDFESTASGSLVCIARK